MSDRPTMADAFLRLQHMTETFSGFAPHEIETMGMDEYARLTGRSLRYQPEHVAGPAPEPPEPVFTEMATSPEPVGIDPDSDDYFLTWRQNRVSGGEGKGIFDSVGSQSAEYRSAARRQAGRTGWSTSNVTPAPRLEGRYLRHDDQLDHRPAVVRLSNQANVWRG